MMKKSNNSKSYSIADWSIMLNAVLVVIIIMLLKCCDSEKPDSNLKYNELVSEIKAQDVFYMEAMSTIKKLEDSLAVVSKSKSKIDYRYSVIHDTITNSSDSSQFGITKVLCPITNDSVPFREINYCLAEGKKASELLEVSSNEIAILNNQKSEYIKAAEISSKSLDVCMNSNYKLSEENAELLGKLDLEGKRKKRWRGAAIISVIVNVIKFAL